MIHNKWHNPELFYFLEFKGPAAGLTGGQGILLKSLRGSWEERNTGRLIDIRFAVLRPGDESRLPGIVRKVWPDSSIAG
ncbi:MAG TPA: hypothetical protein VEM32_08805 [Geobacteraceae bacterium]|nr:hypothetical protein [Geobacteraceae bacterium]